MKTKMETTSMQGLHASFPKLGVPLWGPYKKDEYNFGHYIGFSLFQETATSRCTSMVCGRETKPVSGVATWGDCQNYGPFLGTLNMRCRIAIGTQKGTIILTTTHI